MFFLSLFGFILVFSAKWAFDYFGLSCFEQIVFHLKVPLEGTNTQFIPHWLRQCGLPALVAAAVLRLICSDVVCLLAFWICLIWAMCRIGLPEFICNQFRFTDLYEKYYVDGREVAITFPEKKRNLILIYAESLENTYTSRENGGNSDADLIPELSALARENLNFSHHSGLGGAHVVAGTGWTTGGLVAQSSGVPLCFPASARFCTDHTPFLPGAWTLGDILRREGYEQEFLIGSEAAFGGRKFYYDKHGSFTIFDLSEAKRQGRLPEDYREFWGYEDKKLFDFAKEEVTRLAGTGKPFHLTMLTVDTHHPYGYADSQYRDEHPQRMSNIIRGSSRKIGEFVAWLKTQPFYEDTTIVISGDHLSMAAEYIHAAYDRDYERTIFNAFIHPAMDAPRRTDRCFTSFDLYPTILSAMGAKIEGDRLGLGVSLFSGRKTLAEQLGPAHLDRELRKQSRYYRKKIMES